MSWGFSKCFARPSGCSFPVCEKSLELLKCPKLALRVFFQHAVLHDDLIVYFHKHAPAFVPERCLAIAVARAGAGDDVRQSQLPAGKTDIDELIFWQMELRHHRLSIRTAKAEPF